VAIVKNDLAGIEAGILVTLVLFVALVALCFFEKWGWI
jgi:tetrahydromethanopterin S-methyltransferase subunit F